MNAQYFGTRITAMNINTLLLLYEIIDDTRTKRY